MERIDDDEEEKTIRNVLPLNFPVFSILNGARFKKEIVGV